MNKKIIWGVVIVIIIIAGGFSYNFLFKPRITDCCHGEQYGIVIEQPTINEDVQLPITIKGYLSGVGVGWSAFEGVAGSVQVFDANNKAISNIEQLKATTDWMKPVVHFEATVGDREMMSHLTTQTGFLVFKNENAKGDPVDDREFRLLIKFADNQNISGWKTYTDIKQGYGFQYPKEFSLGEPDWSESVRLFHKVPYDFNIFIRIDPNKVDMPENGLIYPTGSLNWKFDTTGSDALSATIYYLPIVRNRTLIITKHNLSDTKESEEILKEILSTFKFTK